MPGAGEMQSRDFSRWFGSPSWEDSFLYRSFVRLSCQDGKLRLGSYMRMNQGLLVLTIVSCVLLSRFFVRNWFINLAVAAVLLSRGRLIAANGYISGQSIIMCLMTLWMCGVFHWLRSGSRTMLIFVGVVPFLLMGIDMSLTPLGFAIPLVSPSSSSCAAGICHR